MQPLTGDFFSLYTYSMTNLCLGCDSVAHELIAHFLVSVTQLSLNILFGKRVEACVNRKKNTLSSWNRKHFTVSHRDDNVCCATERGSMLRKYYIRSHWRWGRSWPAHPLRRRDAVPPNWWICQEHVSSPQWTHARRQRSGLWTDTRESKHI